jgi:hypothetical protein
MNIVSFEAAKRLKEIGAWQPSPDHGQFWYYLAPNVVKAVDGVLQPGLRATICEKRGDSFRVSFSDSDINWIEFTPSEILSDFAYAFSGPHLAGALTADEIAGLVIEKATKK